MHIELAVVMFLNVSKRSLKIRVQCSSPSQTTEITSACWNEAVFWQMQAYNPTPIFPEEDIMDFVMVNLTINTGLSLISKKAIKVKTNKFQLRKFLSVPPICQSL